jgi:hypothetical protein
LKVPISSFFEDAPAPTKKGSSAPVERSFVNAFLPSKDGLALAKAYMAIKDNALRQRIFELVAQVSGR